MRLKLAVAVAITVIMGLFGGSPASASSFCDDHYYDVLIPACGERSTAADRESCYSQAANWYAECTRHENYGGNDHTYVGPENDHTHSDYPWG